MFITNKNYISIAQAVVDEHAHIIFDKLNTPPVPVHVEEGLSEDGPWVAGQYQACYKGSLFMIGTSSGTYVHDKSSLHLWPMVYMYMPLFSGRYSIRMPKTIAKYKKEVLSTLAHECRHGYQHYHNEVTDLLVLCDMGIVPYSKRPREIDADNYAKQYVKGDK